MVVLNKQQIQFLAKYLERRNEHKTARQIYVDLSHIADNAEALYEYLEDYGDDMNELFQIMLDLLLVITDKK